MYERSYGYRYGETDSSHAPDIAKRIRADIAQAVEEGLLPGAPVKYSVRSETFTGGQSIDVTVHNWPDAWQECDGTVPGTQRKWEGGTMTAQACPNVWCKGRNDPAYAHGATVHQVLTEDAMVAKMTLERIHGAYNHDGSEIQTDYFDVRYYGQVSFESDESARWRAEEKAKKEARRAAVDAAALGDVRRIMVYGREKRTVHDAVEVDGRLKLVCGAQLWRGSLTDFAEGKDLTCSRCVRRAAKRGL